MSEVSSAEKPELPEQKPDSRAMRFLPPRTIMHVPAHKHTHTRLPKIPDFIGSKDDTQVCVLPAYNAVCTSNTTHGGALQRFAEHKGIPSQELALCSVCGFNKSGRLILRRDSNSMDVMLDAREITLPFWNDAYFLDEEGTRDELRAHGLLYLIEPPARNLEEMAKLIKDREKKIAGGPEVYHYNIRDGARLLSLGTIDSLIAKPEESKPALEEILSFITGRGTNGKVQLRLFNADYNHERLESVVKQMPDFHSIASFLQTHIIDPTLKEGTEEHTRALYSAVTGEHNEEEELLGINAELRKIRWQPGATMYSGMPVFDSKTSSKIRGIIKNLSELHSPDTINVGNVFGRGSSRPSWAPRREVYLVEMVKGDKPEVCIVRRLEYDTVDYIVHNGLKPEEAEYRAGSFVCERARMREMGSWLVTQREDHYDFCFDDNTDGPMATAHYTSRPYVHGIATDKITPSLLEDDSHFKDAAFYILGRILAASLVLKRQDPGNQYLGFDGDECIQLDEDGRPASFRFIDFTGCFQDESLDYKGPLLRHLDILRNTFHGNTYLSEKKGLLIASCVEYFRQLKNRYLEFADKFWDIMTPAPSEDVYFTQRHDGIHSPRWRAGRAMELFTNTSHDEIYRLLQKNI